MIIPPILPAIVLAAGFSRRMGRCKLTLTLDGEPLVRRAVRAALDAGLAPVLVTVRPDASPELLEAASMPAWRSSRLPTLISDRPNPLKPASGGLFHALTAFLRASSSSLGISRWSGRN